VYIGVYINDGSGEAGMAERNVEKQNDSQDSRLLPVLKKITYSTMGTNLHNGDVATYGPVCGDVMRSLLNYQNQTVNDGV